VAAAHRRGRTRYCLNHSIQIVHICLDYIHEFGKLNKVYNMGGPREHDEPKHLIIFNGLAHHFNREICPSAYSVDFPGPLVVSAATLMEEICRMSLLQVNFNHLRAFYYVAENKSFTIACEELNISQPTLSLQVQELESYYNIILLKRNKRPIELTDEGKILFSYAKKIFHLVHEMDGSIHDLDVLRAGTIKIGSTRLLATYFLPNILYSIKKDHPRMKFLLHTAMSKQILEKVIDYNYHIGFIGRVAYPGNIICKQISKQKLYFIIAATDNLKDRINLKDLSNYPIILQEEGSATREYIINEFRKRDIALNNYIEAGSPNTVKSMVQLAMGGAFFPFFAIEEEVKENKFRCIEILDGLHYYIDVIYLVERRKAQAVKSIISALSAYSFTP